MLNQQVARQVASLASVGVIIVLLWVNIAGPSSGQVATTTTVAESTHTAVLQANVNQDCTYAWAIVNQSSDFRAYVTEGSEPGLTVLSVGPASTFWIGQAESFSSLTITLQWWDPVEQVYVNTDTISLDGPPCETATTTSTTTTTVVENTTTTTGATTTTVPATTTTVVGATTTTTLPLTELPFTGPPEVGIGFFAGAVLALGAYLLYAADQASRRLRRKARIWRR